MSCTHFDEKYKDDYSEGYSDGYEKGLRDLDDETYYYIKLYINNLMDCIGLKQDINFLKTKYENYDEVYNCIFEINKTLNKI